MSRCRRSRSGPGWRRAPDAGWTSGVRWRRSGLTAAPARLTRSPRFAAWAVVAFGALPLLVSRPAPFTDWPNHIARVFIGVALLRGDPFWQRFYTINPMPVPNEALDFGIGALHVAGLGIDTAATIFLLFSYLVFVAGFVWLGRAAGADDATKPLLGALLFMSGPVMYGLVNYMLGLGLAMALLAAWLRAAPPGRWVIAVLGTVMLFYVHLLAAAAWIVVAGCAELVELYARRRAGLAAWLRAGSTSAAVAVFVALLAASPVAADSIPDADGSNVWYMGNSSIIGMLRWKIAIFVRLLTDHAAVSVAVLTWAGLVAAAAIVARAGRPSLGVAAALAVSAFCAAALVLPESAGTGSLLDYRIALLPLLIGAASVRFAWRSDRARRAVFALLAGIVLVRAAGFTLAFSQQNTVFRAFDAVVRTLPAGSVMLVARGQSDEDIGDQEWWSPPMEHVAARAVLHGIFVPTIFAVASQQPVVLRPELEPWRQEWRIATPQELAAMLDDIDPLCRAAAAQDRQVFLFVAYPGPLAAALDAGALIVATPKFRVLDACRIRPDRTGFAARRAAAHGSRA
jgi:hypothetical protein